MPKNALKKIISKIQIYLLFMFHYFIILCLETEYKLTINDYCTVESKDKYKGVSFVICYLLKFYL